MLILTTTAAVVLTGCGAKDDGKGPSAGGPTPHNSATVTSKWKEYASGVNGFKANFPYGDPTERPYLGSPPAAASAVNSYATEQGTAYAFSVTALRFKKTSTPKSRDEAVAEVAQSIRTASEMKKSDPKDVTWGGKPAKETTFEADPAAGKKGRVVVRQLVTENFGYVGMMRDDGGLTPAEVAKFFDSFELVAK